MNFKKILCFCLAALTAILGIISAIAAESAEESAKAAHQAELMAIKNYTKNGVTYQLDTTAKTATVTKINTTVTSVTIPATVKSGSTTCYVTSIADGVGCALSNLTSVSFESATNLTTIGDNCFSYCPKLATVSFAESNSNLTTIGSNAFYYCPLLTTVSGTSAQTALLDVGSCVFGLSPYMEAQSADFVMIGNVLVRYNGTATEVTVPDNAVAVSDAFFGKDIESVDLGNVQYIGDNAFYNCKSLESVTIPATCTKIGDMAFAGCSSLESVEYLGQLSSIGFCSFANCPNLASFTYGGEETSALVQIGESAFWNDNKLVQVDTGALETVNAGAFFNGVGGTAAYFRIPNTVKTIAEGGYGNLDFKYVTVPKSVEAIAASAFGTTSGAKYVVHKGSKAEEFFTTSGYTYYNYGDITANGKITYMDIRDIANYIAKGTKIEDDTTGKMIITDINEDNILSTKDLHDIMQSIKEEYEAEKAAE